MSDFSFLASDSDLARLIAATDWAATSLGPVDRWPQSVKTTVALILQSPLPIVTLWNDDGIMIYNNAYAVFAGGRHPRLLGSRVREGWPEVAGFNDNVMHTVLAGKTLSYVDQQLELNRNGMPEEVWLNLDYSPVIGEAGKAIGVMAIVVETTTKVRAEQRLQGERQRLHTMFEQAPGFSALFSGPSHEFVLANEACRQLVGRNDIIGKTLMQALPELEGQGFRELLDQVRETGRPYIGNGSRVMLERAAGKGAEERFVDFVFQPIAEEDGTVASIYVQGNDVTEARLAQIARERETHILEILNMLAAKIAAKLDLVEVVQLVTDAGVELTGAQFGAFFYNVMNDKGESYMLYALSGVAPEEFAKFPMPRATAVFQPTFRGESVIRSDDILADPRYGKNTPHHGMPPGHLPVRSYLAVPVISRSGEVLGGLLFGHGDVGVFEQAHETLLVGAAGQAAIAIDNARLFQAAERELNERRRAEEALLHANADLEQRVSAEIQERLKAEEALRQAQKMEALGQLTGGVAHDFNNLLQVITGNLQLLMKDVAGNERANRRIENALAGVNRGSKLASQLLSFGRRQPLDPKVVNIGRFIAGMEDMLRRTLGEAIEIETIRSGGLWNTMVDTTQIENALLNLAINARDAMVDGGKLTIEVGNAYLDDTYVRQHRDIEPGQYVMLAVTDTGTGMSPEIIDQVFEPFFSTKPVGKGTGLGLSMVYGFVKQSGGHIKIYSEVGQGTTIRIYFRRVDQSEDLVTLVPSGPVTGGSETILVAEDDDDVRATVVEMLRDLGYNVLKARDAAGALSVIESGASIDLLFTDVVMPGTLKSAELARQARERLPNVAVLFTSGYTENSIVHGGRLDKGVNLLSKPYTREALARKVRHVLANQKQKNLAAEQVSAAHALQPDASEKALSYSILLVEDEPLIRMGSVDMLDELGHDVTEAGNAEEALAILATRDFDIVMTDLGLPGMSGVDLASMIHTNHPHIALIFATGETRAPDVPAAIGAALLRKPYGTEHIELAIAEAIAGKPNKA